MEQLRLNIIEERKLKELTQKAIAVLLGVGETTFASWEQGRSEPPAEMIVKLADIFEVSTDYLLGHTELVPANGGQGITPIESKLLQAFRKLSYDDQNRIVGMVQAFAI